MSNTETTTASVESFAGYLQEGQYVAVKLKSAPRAFGDDAIPGVVRHVGPLGFRMNLFVFLANSGPLESGVDFSIPWDNLEWVWASVDTDDLELFIVDVADELREDSRRSMVKAGMLQE